MKKLLLLMVILGSAFFYQSADAQVNSKPGYSFHGQSERHSDYKSSSRHNRREHRKGGRHHGHHGARHHRHHRHF